MDGKYSCFYLVGIAYRFNFWLCFVQRLTESGLLNSKTTPNHRYPFNFLEFFCAHVQIGLQFGTPNLGSGTPVARKRAPLNRHWPVISMRTAK